MDSWNKGNQMESAPEGGRSDFALFVLCTVEPPPGAVGVSHLDLLLLCHSGFPTHIHLSALARRGVHIHPVLPHSSFT